ncbi:DUF1028 domain-containing protein [Antarcticimicrobium sediminis]|uniref:DUF1028 domain-containing protein n=1 Tax=Antarcticimicrobium sediminis TaxID=2546227 RepID=A0A4R5EJZ5_9RHOB|nr:DUF1028 domain-containing protein [Antarcticimicrobium sediminis]TDE34931.1 DUF1028 domain-containing protein [Antarcticimicrobium sediminis]
MFQFNTFSIAARCPRTGMLGVAVSTAVPAVGGLCSYIKEGVGAIATQSWVNPYLGIDGLKLLEEGLSAQDTLTRLLADDTGRDDRQIGIVDGQGRTAVHTGASCVDWAGHIVGDGFTVQGNMLIGAATIEAMAAAAKASEAFDLPERLMLVLEAGQAAGGDKRGKQSAALKVFNREAYPWLDVRVDEHRNPVAELRRIFEIAKHQLLTFTKGMPTRANPLAELPSGVTSMLMTPPPYRPGGSGGL